MLKQLRESVLTFDCSCVHFLLASDRYRTGRLTDIVTRQRQCKQRSNHGQKAQHGEKRGSHHIIVCRQRLRGTTLQHKSDKFNNVLRGITINKSPPFFAHGDNICMHNFSTTQLTTYYISFCLCLSPSLLNRIFRFITVYSEFGRGFPTFRSKLPPTSSSSVLS